MLLKFLTIESVASYSGLTYMVFLSTVLTRNLGAMAKTSHLKGTGDS